MCNTVIQHIGLHNVSVLRSVLSNEELTSGLYCKIVN
jgi:hypothetical protein